MRDGAPPICVRLTALHRSLVRQGLFWDVAGRTDTAAPAVDGYLPHERGLAFDWLLSWTWPTIPDEDLREMVEIAEVLKDHLLVDLSLPAHHVRIQLESYVRGQLGASVERVHGVEGLYE